MPPPPIESGWVKDAPAPVLEIVSGADETTDVSVVGKFPVAVPFAFTPGLGGADEVSVVDETTDASPVANRVAAAFGDADADGVGDVSARAGVSFSSLPPLC